MAPKRKSREPETVDPPFTTWSAEGLFIGVPIGIVMLVVGGALRVNIALLNRFLLVCIAAGIISNLVLMQRASVEKLSAGYRTALEMLILFGFASMVCFSLVHLFLAGRIVS